MGRGDEALKRHQEISSVGVCYELKVLRDSWAGIERAGCKSQEKKLWIFYSCF